MHNTIVDDINKGKEYMSFFIAMKVQERLYREGLGFNFEIGKSNCTNGELSGIALLILLGEKTAYSRFSIPATLIEDSMCNIPLEIHKVELLMNVKLIIWDEAPRVHKHYFEALNRTLKDLVWTVDPANENLQFGSKTIIFGENFIHILPIIPKGSRNEVVNTMINYSFLHKHYTTFRLTKNIRPQSMAFVVESSNLKKLIGWISSASDDIVTEENIKINKKKIIYLKKY